MKAALFVGGWEGHAPTRFSDWYAALLTANGFTVDIHDTLEPLEHPERLADVDLITPIWSSARSGHREEFGNMTKPQEDGLLKLIGEGCGIAGWHREVDFQWNPDIGRTGGVNRVIIGTAANIDNAGKRSRDPFDLDAGFCGTVKLLGFDILLPDESPDVQRFIW